MTLTKEQKDNDLVKSLLNSNFSEEVVAGWINSGSINLVKSIPEEETADPTKEKSCGSEKAPEVKKSADAPKDGDEEDGEGDEEDLEKPKEGSKKKSCNTPKTATTTSLKGGSDTEMPGIIKSVTDEVLSSVKTSNDDILKSIPTIVSEAMAPTIELIEKSFNGVRLAIEAFGNSAPSFKGAGLTQSVIQKSIEPNSFQKDEGGKMSLSVTKDRTIVRELIQKSIEEESDSAIRKSIMDNTTNYILDPIGGAIGEPAAIYLYTQKGVKLTQ